MRVLALGGIGGPVLFSLVALVSAARRPDYSHVGSFISELGATGTTGAALMNYGGFIPAGVLLTIFGIGLFKALPLNRLTVIACVLIALFGAGVAVSGVISCDISCPEDKGSLENLLHNRIAPVSFVSLIISAALLSIEFRRLPAWNHLWLYSVLTSALGFIFLAMLVLSLEERTLTGLWQRLLLATLFLWCTVIGWHAFRHNRPPSNNSFKPNPLRGSA